MVSDRIQYRESIARIGRFLRLWFSPSEYYRLTDIATGRSYNVIMAEMSIEYSERQWQRL
jgi:hypothetical protein